jgi:hypothetical protein
MPNNRGALNAGSCAYVNISAPKISVAYIVVSTVGYNKEVVRRYIQNQEKVDKQIEQLSLFKGSY